jgi:hypothetical protein
MSLTRNEVLQRLSQDQPVLVNGQLFDKTRSSHWGCLSDSEYEEYEWTIPPEKKMVPLGPDDIDLHRDLFRFYAAPRKSYVATAKGCDTVTINNHAYSFWALKDTMERSIDGGATWQRCEKEVEQ